MDRLESAWSEVVMNNGTPISGETTSPLLPLVAVLFAVAIFVVDTFTHSASQLPSFIWLWC